MKNCFALVILDERTLDSMEEPFPLESLRNVALRKLPLRKVICYETFDEAKAAYDADHEEHKIGFIYGLRVYDKTDSAHVWEENDAVHERAVNAPRLVMTSDIVKISSSSYLAPGHQPRPLGSFPQISVPSSADEDEQKQLAEEKLRLLNRLRGFTWLNEYLIQPNVGKTWHKDLYQALRQIEENAVNSASDEKYLETLKTLHAALELLSKRIGIDSEGRFFRYWPNHQPEMQPPERPSHEEFKAQLEALGLTSSSSKLYQKLGYVLLAISLTFVATALVGVCGGIPLGLAAGGALGTGYSSFSFFKTASQDPGRQYEESLLQASEQVCRVYR